MKYLKNNKIWDTKNPKWIVVAEDKKGNSLLALDDDTYEKESWDILYYDPDNRIFIRYSSVKRDTDDPTPPRREVIVIDDIERYTNKLYTSEDIINNWVGIVYWDKLERIFYD